MRSLVLLAPLALFLATPDYLVAQEDLKAFPKAEEGFERHVLRLKPQPDETSLKVELIVGKTVETDSVNQYFFAGKLEEVTVEGWGYTRYFLKELGPMAGTLIASPPDAPKVKRFIRLRGEPYLVRYNSRLPVVVTVPQDAQVRYRIWRADKEAKPMAKE